MGDVEPAEFFVPIAFDREVEPQQPVGSRKADGVDQARDTRAVERSVDQFVNGCVVGVE